MSQYLIEEVKLNVVVLINTNNKFYNQFSVIFVKYHIPYTTKVVCVCQDVTSNLACIRNIFFWRGERMNYSKSGLWQVSCTVT